MRQTIVFFNNFVLFNIVEQYEIIEKTTKRHVQYVTFQLRLTLERDIDCKVKDSQ